jgi:hypothetical protein
VLLPHPATASSARHAIAPATRNPVFFERNWLKVSAARAKNASKAAGGKVYGAEGGTNVVDLAVVEMVSVTCEVVVTEGGLKLQSAPAGSPLHEKVIAPSPELVACDVHKHGSCGSCRHAQARILKRK